jgi:hypothetical protein
MKVRRKLWLGLLAGVAAVTVMTPQVSAQQKRPNIVMLMTDDTLLSCA